MKLFTRTCTIAALAAAAPMLHAQTQYVRADRMLDVETGRIVQGALVGVDGDRIVSVSTGSAPEGVHVHDLGDMTLLPGLMDAHTHLAYLISGDWWNLFVTETAADFALRAIPHAQATLMAGFTTVRDVGSAGFVDIALEHARQRGDIHAPRIIGAGYSISITGGHCDQTGWRPGILEGSPETGVADGVDEVLKAVRYQIKHGASVIKICATAGVLSFEGPVGAQQMTLDEMTAAVDEAARHGLKVAAHAHGTEGIKAAIQAGVASIDHGSMLDDEAIAMMKDRGTYLVPTSHLVDAIPYDELPDGPRQKAEYVLPFARESLRQAIAQGAPIAFGTDAAVFPHGDNAKEFAVYVNAGMSPLDAIRTATVNTADLFGVDDRGRIAEGMLADMIAVPGNPLEDITTMENVQFVMLGGEVVKHPAEHRGMH